MSEYSFKGRVVAHRFGKVAYTVVYVPARIVARLPRGPGSRTRVDVFVRNYEFNAAVMPSSKGHYLMFSSRILREIDARCGDLLAIRLALSDQNRVDVPPELREALAARPDLARKWATLTPGKRRGLCYRVASAKRAETREERVFEILELVSDL